MNDGVSVARPVDEWLAEAAAHANAGRLDQAANLLGQILAARPNHHQALHQAGLVAHSRKRSGEAVELIERAIAIDDSIAVYHRNLCELYRSLSRLDEALAHGRRAVELTPDDSGAHYNLGVLLYDRLEIDEAIVCVRRALELDPKFPAAHFELAEGLLLTGQFAEGWEEYEWRFSLPDAPPLMPSIQHPQWDGKPMNGTLMLIADQGFGDTIQFCRYIPMVAERCPNIVLAGSNEMRPIVMQQAGIKGYFDRWEHMPPVDAYCALSGLPRLFGTNLENIPCPVPYVRADPAKIELWRKRLDGLVPKGYRRIGIVWAGRPTHGNDFNRSTTLNTFAPIAALDGVALISLQMGPALPQIGNYWGRAPLINLGGEINDFTDTMAILDGLERLVAVDTGVAHLAAAMGKPVSIFVPHAPDWRWLLNRMDTPWYPSIQLFRQKTPGQWSDVAQAVAASLRS